MVRRHPDGGYTALPANIGNDTPDSMVSDPSYPDPWTALESIAPAHRDKIYMIHAECGGNVILGDLDDIAEGKHKA
jgi:hypothetical protein